MATLSPVHADAQRPPWGYSLGLLLAISLGIAAMWRVLGQGPLAAMDWGILVLFAISFSLVVRSCAVALLGFVHRRATKETAALAEPGALDMYAATAIVMPICNEDVGRVFDGLRVMYESLAATGELPHFDFFILSDSSDPNCWIEEELAWLKLCRRLGAFGRIFYRKRRVARHRKSGNIADFCRRWGGKYRYMLVLDADSIMTGSAVVELVHIMQRQPRIGILQTLPLPVNRDTLFARIQQFAARVYGGLYASGASRLRGAAHTYWGHNAILRLQPFIEHCALPQLPGQPPLGGPILSHDFVEAALMRAAGWEVCLVEDLAGSYEENPPTLLDHVRRDRRWCQGNLQHLRLLFARGLALSSRIDLALGAMAYLASPLWLALLILSTISIALGGGAAHLYRAPEGIALLSVTMTLLFAPKLLAVVDVVRREGNLRLYGGAWHFGASVFLESLFSILLAPILMLFHSGFVLTILLGRPTPWLSPSRQDSATSWREAFRRHALATLAMGASGVALYYFLPDFFYWMLPVLLGPVLAIPISVYSSRRALGGWARQRRLFLTAEESAPPEELTQLRVYTEKHRAGQASARSALQEALARAVFDPHINALHVSLLRKRPEASEAVNHYRRGLQIKFMSGGPPSLDEKETMDLLWDKDALTELHLKLWRSCPPPTASWARTIFQERIAPALRAA